MTPTTTDAIAGLPSDLAGVKQADDRFQVRHRFVGLLFALAMTEVARQGVQLVKLWEPSEHWPIAACAHLLLSALIIAASWVGWTNSISSEKSLKNVFDWQFVTLMFDVFLVFAYFVIVSYVEIPELSKESALVVSAHREARGLFIVFSFYALWDVITDIVRPRRKAVRAFIVYVYASLICAALAFLVCFLCNGVTRTVSVVLFDMLSWLGVQVESIQPFLCKTSGHGIHAAII